MLVYRKCFDLHLLVFNFCLIYVSPENFVLEFMTNAIFFQKEITVLSQVFVVSQCFRMLDFTCKLKKNFRSYTPDP